MVNADKYQQSAKVSTEIFFFFPTEIIKGMWQKICSRGKQDLGQGKPL